MLVALFLIAPRWKLLKWPSQYCGWMIVVYHTVQDCQLWANCSYSIGRSLTSILVNERSRTHESTSCVPPGMQSPPLGSGRWCCPWAVGLEGLLGALWASHHALSPAESSSCSILTCTFLCWKRKHLHWRINWLYFNLFLKWYFRVIGSAILKIIL